jgi:16S rRNA (cytidine1402-2'-O)-methyltransferase
MVGPARKSMRKPKPARSEFQNPLEDGLYIAATPIGNARDISLRTLEVLGGCDLILAEDTRNTAKLLAIHGISRPLMSYNDHNASRVRPQIIKRLEKGERIALVSDAGTPLISDPGYKLVRETIAARATIHVVPGASAALAALVISGLPTDRFFFVGFLPNSRDARRSALAEVRTIRSTLVFFEAPQRLKESLEDMQAILGDRQASVARELTKLHEEVRRGKLSELTMFYEQHPPRGEVTVIVGSGEPGEPDWGKADTLLEKSMVFMPLRSAVDLVSEALMLPRKTVYARALVRKGDGDDGV